MNELNLINSICKKNYKDLYNLKYKYRYFFQKAAEQTIKSKSKKANKKLAKEILLYLLQNPMPYWRNKGFPVNINPKVKYLTLPNGRVLEDAVIWKDFLQDEVGIDPSVLWKQLLKYPKWPDNKEIPFRPKGDDVHWITGKHPALHYRGNALKRSKIWAQKDYKKGMLKYGYTGWQHKISYATHDIKYISELDKIINNINSNIPNDLNHWIVTYYEDGKDYIGFHSDKPTDFAKNSYFLVIKLGAPRKFEFKLKDTDNIFFSEILSAGTALFVRANAKGFDANSIVQHGVPAYKEKKVGPSGSLVGREIVTLVPWTQVRKNIERSERERIKRKLAKLKKKNSKMNLKES